MTQTKGDSLIAIAHAPNNFHAVGRARRQWPTAAANASQCLRALLAHLLILDGLLQDCNNVGAQGAALLLGDALGGLINLFGDFSDIEGGHRETISPLLA